MSQKQAQQIQLQYVDRREIDETYVDLLEKLFIDGTGARLEFCVTRLNDPKPPKPPTGKKLTACRLVMPFQAFLEMAGKINNILQALEQQGAITRTPVSPPQGSGKPN